MKPIKTISGLHFRCLLILAVGLTFSVRMSAQLQTYNGVAAQVKRAAALMGSYLTVIATPYADSNTVKTYKGLAKALFTPDATVEISSLNRRPPVTLSAYEYVDRHYDELIKRTGYDTINLQWDVREAVPNANTGLIECVVMQTFRGVDNQSDRDYADKTIKSITVTFELVEQVNPGGQPLKRLQISGIRVRDTFHLDKRGYQKGTSAESER
jgi:hypothetical protein